MFRRHLALGLLLATSAFACAAQPADEDEAAAGGEDALTQKADDEWFYGGPLKKLANATITVSLKANTAHVVGYLPADTQLPTLPHVKTRPENGKLRVDVVYPIASADTTSHSNSRPGTYTFYSATPYRPDGLAYTVSAGSHFVTWGGFPFLGYNNGIAFHGPITSELSSTGDQKTWYLRRGRVSSGCNRMQGENVVELAHLIGIDMHKSFGANVQVENPSAAKVIVTNEYDKLDDKFIDVDYATDVGITRPPADQSVMFGSWVASATPDGKDLPPDMKWEGGVNGKPYVFAEHIIPGMVCNVAKKDLPGLRTLQTKLGGTLGDNFCAKKDCVLGAIAANKDAKATCGL